jgi:hypothetical protein
MFSGQEEKTETGIRNNPINNTEMVAENAAIGGALVDSLYLHHKRLAEVFRYFDKDFRCDFNC